MPESNSSHWPKVLTIIFLVLVAFLISFYWYTSTNLKLEPNWYQEVYSGRWSQDIEKARKLAEDGNPLEAIEILENVKSQITDPGQKAVVDLTIAHITFFGIGMQTGAELYAAIAAEAKYPDVSRAYAIMVVADQFGGLSDKNILKPFFSDQEFNGTNGATLALSLFQRAYDRYPFGLAAAKLGIDHILKTATNSAIPDSDYFIVMGYVDDINKNLPELETSDGFKIYIPVTLLNKARLLGLIEDIGRPTNESIEVIYLATIARARTLGILSTEQFAVLSYADYLAKKKEKNQVIELLSESLPSSIMELDSMVMSFLASEERIQNYFPDLYKLQEEDVDVRVVYNRLVIPE